MSFVFYSRFRHWASKLRARLAGPRLVYGFFSNEGVFLPHTRISSSTVIEGRAGLICADHVFIGHHNFLDASGGLTLGEGCQITNHVSVLTHSSHVALRLHGRSYFGKDNPAGMQKAATHIGAYVFVGPHCVIAPGTRIGKGALLRAYSYVSGEVPAFAVMAGQPAVQVGDTREGDARWLAEHPELQATYDAWARSVHY
jgi:acetyltransferase-like isoleucine patch superfamily enzyme